MWWIIGFVLMICIFGFLWLFTHSADMKNQSKYVKNIEDDEQERTVTMLKQTL